jgi:cytochrome c2
MRTDNRICRGLFAGLCALASEFSTWAAAADADNGKRIAQLRCSPCHIVVPNQRQEVAKSPPFDVIARQNGFDARNASVFNPCSSSPDEPDLH